MNLLWSAIALCQSAIAQTVAGITFPDRIQINESALVLNGAGLREKYWIDIYVAALYLPKASAVPQAIIEQNTPKRIQLQFIYPRVTKSQMIETLEENFAQNPNISPETRQAIQKCTGWMEDFTTGDEIIFDYEPSSGTSIFVKGQKKGTIPGPDFMNAVYTIYLGPAPASENLKEALLGLD